jgi:hypothetical protein
MPDDLVNRYLLFLKYGVSTSGFPFTTALGLQLVGARYFSTVSGDVALNSPLSTPDIITIPDSQIIQAGDVLTVFVSINSSTNHTKGCTVWLYYSEDSKLQLPIEI